MKTLVLDTSNQYLVVALYQDGTCLQKIQEQGNRKQSEYTMTYIQKLLQLENWTMKEMDEVVITVGPGSYTGVRVAMTIAKTLAAILPIKVKTVSSLLAYASTKQAISVLDARGKKLFVGRYNDGHTQEVEQLLTIEQTLELLTQYPDYQVVGDVALLGREEQEVDLADSIYQLSRMIEPCNDVDNLIPQYIKEVEAKKICL